MNKEQLEQEIAELTTRIDSLKERLENRKEDLLLLDSDDILQSGGVLEKEIVKLKKENEDLKIRLNELTSPTDTKNCPHRFVSTCLNMGEPKVFCRYYEGQPCDDTDFCNCMFRENTRLKEKFSRITETVKQLIALSDSLVNICDLSLGITSGPIVGDIFMLSKKIQSRVHILGKLNTNL